MCTTTASIHVRMPVAYVTFEGMADFITYCRNGTGDIWDHLEITGRFILNRLYTDECSEFCPFSESSDHLNGSGSVPEFPCIIVIRAEISLSTRFFPTFFHIVLQRSRHPLKVHVGFNTKPKSKAIGPQLQTAWNCRIPTAWSL